MLGGRKISSINLEDIKGLIVKKKKIWRDLHLLVQT